MKIDDFAVFILTHGRANNVITYKTLRTCGYTGDIYLIIDNEDDQADEYRRIYGDKVIMFDKPEIAARFDEGDNFHDRRTITHARNASFEIAEQLGIKYFVQMDDDYKNFRYRFGFDFNYIVSTPKIKSLDCVFNAILDFFRNAAIASVAMAQGGDYIGGSKSSQSSAIRLKRKCMNTFFCATDRRFPVMGRMNEDVNTYVTLGNRGQLFLTLLSVDVSQVQTQSNPGGITETYLKYGTYIKSFYTVMYAPSCVKVTTMKSNYLRIHHAVDWSHAVPKIVSESLRKS